jgi:hypothetical protein
MMSEMSVKYHRYLKVRKKDKILCNSKGKLRGHFGRFSGDGIFGHVGRKTRAGWETVWGMDCLVI